MVNWETKSIQYEGITYTITGTDSNQHCIIGENTDHNLHIIYWTHRTKKRIKEVTTGYDIRGLSRDDCLILDAKAYTCI